MKNIPLKLFEFMDFDQLLCHLSQQTNKKFKIYIGDDFSPNSPLDIIKKYSNSVSVEYKKFSNNYGRTSLVSHWNRCLALLQDEDWVWVLPDDDSLAHTVPNG